jgi:hypothetical protein
MAGETARALGQKASPSAGESHERPGAARIALWLLLVATGLGVAALSFRQPLSADDFTNSLVLREDPGLLGFVAHYYAAWTGRVTGMALLWFALTYRAAFALLNGAAFAALAWLTAAVGLGRVPALRTRDVDIVAFVAVAYWFGLPAIAESVLWVTGSVTYLWSAVLMLTFALPYRLAVGAERHAGARRWSVELALMVPMIALGAVAGASQELVVAALLVVLVAFAAHAVRSKSVKRIGLHLWAGAAGLLGGAAASFLAPGNAVRSTTSGNHASSLLGSLAQFVTYIAKAFASYLPRMYPWLLCALVVAIPLAIVSGAPRAAVTTRRRFWAVWTVAGLAALAPFVFAPGVALLAGARTCVFSATLFTVAAVSLLADPATLLERIPRRWTDIAVCVLLAVALVEVAGSLQVAGSIRAQVAQRETYIAAQKTRGVRDVVVAPLAQRPYRTVYYVDIEADPMHWLNVGLSKWYGLDSIRLGTQPAP